ncbi:hypothetical protein M983_1051 [Proteus myxofaciens ATCC 19692]|uniref:Fimbrial-type adhesion domain-containing protein n=2 Tax=Proteus myxofaciens TaxID=184072 RepID=A0A198GBZ2_9GAMM|nr:hypothetical protein M983_1051 [Proteus myxofaciens ATCC 19692]
MTNNDARHWAGYFGIGFNDTYYPHDCLSTSRLLKVDSFTGVYVKNKSIPIIIVVEGTATGAIDGGSSVAKGTWDSNGVFSGDAMPGSGYTWCGAYQNNSGTVTQGDYANFSGRITLYAQKNANKGTYTFPNIEFVKGNNLTKFRESLVESSTFTIVDPLSCTISPPPEIAFGDVNLWDFPGNTGDKPGGNRKDVLGAVDGNLTVDCIGGDSSLSVPAKLTLKGTTQGYVNDLKMTMDSDGSVAPATVRASIQKLYSPCNSNGIWFSADNEGTKRNVIDINLQQGINTIPYRFSLCSLGEGYKQGSASGTATITLDWD